jgi:hypothetical protein
VRNDVWQFTNYNKWGGTLEKADNWIIASKSLIYKAVLLSVSIIRRYLRRNPMMAIEKYQRLDGYGYRIVKFKLGGRVKQIIRTFTV